MTEEILHYLLVFDHEQDHLIEVLEFGENADAAGRGLRRAGSAVRRPEAD